GLAVPDRIGHEEPAPQDLANVFLDDRLDALLAFAPEDRENLLGDLFPEGIVLARLAGEQGGDDRTAIELGDRLGQILEEVLEPSPPTWVKRDLVISECHDLVDEDQDRQVLIPGNFQQIDKQRLGGSAVALFVLGVGVETAKALAAGNLIRQDAPWVA